MTTPAATAPPECGPTRQIVIANMSMSPTQKECLTDFELAASNSFCEPRVDEGS
jgi:hypothetical protein